MRNIQQLYSPSAKKPHHIQLHELFAASALNKPSGETLGHLEERNSKQMGLTPCADLTAKATAITQILPEE